MSMASLETLKVFCRVALPKQPADGGLQTPLKRLLRIIIVAATLPPEVTAAARERGRSRDLEATIQELLVELSAWDSQPPEPSQP